MRRSASDGSTARTRMRPLAAVVAAAALVGSSLIASVAQADANTVTVADAAFAACLTAELDTDPGNTFTTDQLASVETLHCDGDGTGGAVNSLAGASYLTNLTELSLMGSGVSDLGPLSGLKNLASLSVQSSALGSVAPLSSLTQLDSLNLESSQLTDLSALARLTNLTQLGVTAPVGSVSPVSSLTHLVSLDIVSDPLTDLSPLATLTGLQSLHLTTPAVGDLGSLAGLKGLTELGIDSRRVASLAPLAGLTGLTSLTISSPGVTSLAPIAGLSGLTYLSVTDSAVSDVSPVGGLRKLTELHLDRDQVVDLTPLKALTGLSVLSVDGDLVADPSPLAALVNLDSLSLTDNQLTDVSSLKTLVNYYWLDLSGNQIADISPLKVAAGKDANRRLGADGQVVALPIQVGVPATLSLKALDGSMPTLSPSAGVTISSGNQVTVSQSGSYTIGFVAGGLDTAGYSFSGTVTVGSNLIVSSIPTIDGDPAIGATLLAVPGRWGPAPVTFTYQWLADGTPIAGATASNYVVAATDRGKQLSVTVTGSKDGYPSVSTTSDRTGTVGNPLVSPASTPTISGSAVVGSTLTAASGTWASGASLAYQWLRSGAAIPGATTSTYVVQAADVGSVLAVKVTGSADGCTSVSRTSVSTAVVPPQATFTTAPIPTISGTTKVGSTLTAQPGAWKPSGAAFSYQWLRAGSAIGGATGASYTLAAEDAGKTVSVQVTATKLGVSPRSQTSKSTAKVAAGTLAPTTPTTTTTKPVVDGTITAQASAWGPGTVNLAYQWYKVSSSGKSSVISGATSASYQVAGSIAGYRLKAKVTGTRTGYGSASRYTRTTSAVAKARLTVVQAPAVSVEGTPRVGKLLTASPGSHSPSASYAYQWYRGGSAISRATGATYRLASADKGRTLKVRVTAKRTGYVSLTAYGYLSGTVQAGIAAVTPKLSDTTPKVGQVLSITAATSADRWSPKPTTVTYQWFRNSTAIAGATSASYTVQSDDLGKAIRVEVTGSASDYAAVARRSASSSHVAKGSFATLGTVTIVASGNTLTAAEGTWSPKPDAFTYQWYRDGKALSGATAQSYAYGGASGAYRVKVTAVRAGYTSASVYSAEFSTS